jgi:hypothetical protein
MATGRRAQWRMWRFGSAGPLEVLPLARPMDRILFGIEPTQFPAYVPVVTLLPVVSVGATLSATRQVLTSDSARSCKQNEALDLFSSVYADQI